MRRACALRRRYGRAHGVGHIEAQMGSGGRWHVQLIRDGGTSEHFLHGPTSRADAISFGQKEAKARGIPFVMGL